MTADLGDTAAEVARLALKIGSATADAVSFVADLGEELPLVQPVLKTIKAIREKIDAAKSNQEELAALHQRCAHITACFIVKCTRDSSELDVAPLEECTKAVERVVGRCSHRGMVSRIIKASSDKDEIFRLKERIGDLEGDLTLAGIAVLEQMGKSQATKQRDILANQEAILGHLPKPPAKLASVPKGTPARKSWHVERRQVMETVFEALAGGGEPRLVGLVGGSGSGKTTAASEIVRSARAREEFSDGIVWFSFGEGVKGRLQSLILQLARVVHKDIGSSLGRYPAAAEDGAAYIKQSMEKAARGKGLRCLLVADNVWEKEVIYKLLETGMWVLLSTRNEELVTGAHGQAVGVDELSEGDAESVLRRAAELSPEVRLPDDAVDLIELCGRVAMDLAFVGRWSTVRGRQDRGAWADAADKVRAVIDKVGAQSAGDRRIRDGRSNRREAILRAGFEDLAIGSDDERVQRLYLSLAVLPNGHAFSVKDAAVLLYDRTPSTEDEASVAVVVETLERWTIIQSEEGAYRMHDAHSSFARESLEDHGYVRRPAVKRLVRSISSLEALRSIDRFTLKRLWLAAERVGGDGWAKTRPYVRALDAMGRPSNSLLLRQSIEAVAWFQEAQEEWELATTTWRRLLSVEEKDLGADHPYVLNTYRSLASCADRLGSTQEAAEWLGKEQEALPLALARAQSEVEGGGAGGLDDAVYLASLATTVLKCKPDGGAEIETLLRRSLEIKEAELGPEDVQVAGALHDLGVCIRQGGGRLDEAEGVLARCLKIREAKLGEEDVRVAGALHDLGVCVREAGRLGEAEALLGRCLGIKEARLGPRDAEVAVTLYELGVCVRGAGRPGEAEELLRRCLGIVEVELGRESAGAANTLCVLVACARDAGRLGEAEALLRRCLKIKEASLDPDHEQVAATLHDLGACVRQLGPGRLEEATRLLNRCLEIKEARLGLEDVEVARTLFEIGACAREAGRLEEAEGLLRRCLAIVEAKLGPQNVGVANILKHLAMCAKEAGRLDEAEAFSKRSRAINEAKLGQGA